MNREIKAVSKAIAKGLKINTLIRNDGAICGLRNGIEYDFSIAAQAAIAASDSQYVKGLVEALKFYAKPETYTTSGHSQIDADMKPILGDKGEVARKALQQLPDDKR
jgi:hypothetical protein